ncbi:MAG: SOS response-associated peptidase [Pseudomonadota bacterium]
MAIIHGAIPYAEESMCGRFTLTDSPDEIARHFSVGVTDNFPARYNIAPTQAIAVIRTGEGPDPQARTKRFYHLMRWGFLPAWAGKPGTTFTRPLINARSETVMEKRTFSSAFKRRRCLVPANGYFEWTTENRKKQPWYIHPTDDEDRLFGFAAIWETYLDPGGGEMDGVAILTTAASEALRPLHGREPVVIPPEDYGRWQSTDETDCETLLPLLHPAPEGFWQWHKVTPDVGNVRNEGAVLIKPYGQMGLL